MLIADKPEKDLLAMARQAEAEGKVQDATELYRVLIRKNDLEAAYYSRLMILYRKQKDYRAEMDIIEKGMRVFDNYFRSRAERSIGNHKAQVRRLSAALLKKTGLGAGQYLPEPLSTWKKRKEQVEKRLKKVEKAKK